MNKKYNTHLSLNERIVIQTGIENGATKTTIAQTLGRDLSTISKEIKRNVIIKPSRSNFNYGKEGQISQCRRRDVSPGACNGCSLYSNCKKERTYYNANKANDKYRTRLVDSRSGIHLSESERRKIDKIISPLIRQGQSLSQILVNHQEIEVSNKTLYNYIDQGVFRDYNRINLSLKRKVQRKTFIPRYRPRNDSFSLLGHLYSDFEISSSICPDASIIEMDTLYNSQQRPFLQTFIHIKSKFMFGFIHNSRTVDSMVSGIDTIESKLGTDLFKELFNILLTDRGSEFKTIDRFEFNKEGEKRLKLYFCDPMSPQQKPNIENNHNFVREFIPNGSSMSHLTQECINHMFSNINNTPRKSLEWDTPFRIFENCFKENSKTLFSALGITYISPDDVTLNKTLF